MVTSISLSGCELIKPSSSSSESSQQSGTSEFSVSSSSSEIESTISSEIDYGELTIDDITLIVEETVTIEPVFSKPEGVADINYEFEDSNISIAEGVVTGLVAGTETIVTATTSRLETTFTVTVNEKPVLSDNMYTNTSSTNLFEEVETGVYEKYNTTYAETFLYQDGVAVAGSKYMASGKLEIRNPAEFGQGVVIAKHDDTHFVRFVVEYLENDTYQIFTDYKNGSDDFAGYRVIESSSYEIDFDLVVNGDMTYFFVDNILCEKVQQDIGESHAGFGGANATTTRL